jgi:hypothetical protein
MSTIKSATTTARGAGKWQGMNWIRQEKRLAIYLRDGLACAWCGAGVEQGAQLSLDHIICHVAGGSNHESNLVTCCTRCNSSRSDRTVEVFAAAVAGYINHGVSAEDVLAHVRDCAGRSLKAAKVEAAAMVARRGSAAKALAEMGK